MVWEATTGCLAVTESNVYVTKRECMLVGYMRVSKADGSQTVDCNATRWWALRRDRGVRIAPVGAKEVRTRYVRRRLPDRR
jgi:hypothetical protein